MPCWRLPNHDDDHEDDDDDGKFGYFYGEKVLSLAHIVEF